MGLSPKKAYLSEIFSSIQGEGLLVGLRQIFVRFSGCSLTCDYCDTPESRVRSSDIKVQKGTVPDLRIPHLNPPLIKGGTKGGVESGLFPSIYTIPNPVSPAQLTEIVNSFDFNLHHSISLTGGEPLEQADFLREWLPMMRRGMAKGTVPDLRTPPLNPPLDKGGSKGGLKIYLETNGLLPAHLSEVIEFIDIIGMDIKLPSVAGVKPFWSLHRDFLKVASKRDVFVKVVVSREVSEGDINQAADVVCSVDPDIPFIIQPRTPVDMNADDIVRLQEIAAHRLTCVRVIPQVHKFLNLI